MSQSKIVMNHLKTRKTLTSVEAIGLYGITRLAAVIQLLRKRGVKITTTSKRGVNRCNYAVYSLTKEV